MKNIVIYCINKNKFIIITRKEDDDQYIIIDHVFSELAKTFTQQKTFYNILKKLNVDNDTMIALVNSENLESDLENYLTLARMFLNFNLSRFNIDKVILCINRYHKYIRNREANSNDCLFVFDKLVKSRVIQCISQTDKIKIENKSEMASVSIKKAMLSLYYMSLKSKISQYVNKEK